MPDDAVVAPRAAGDLGDRQRRGVRGEDACAAGRSVELAEQRVLDLEVLEHRLDDEVAGLARSSSDVGRADSRARIAVTLSAAFILPRSTDLAKNASRLLARRGRARRRACRRQMVRKPARAATMAMPAPMVPQPATPTVRCLYESFRSLARRSCRPDQLAVHLVGAFPDLRDLGVAHQPLDAIVRSSRSRRAAAPPRWRCAWRGPRRASWHRGLDAEVAARRRRPARRRDRATPRTCASSVARSASRNWLPWNSTMRRPDCRRVVDVGDHVLERGDARCPARARRCSGATC